VQPRFVCFFVLYRGCINKNFSLSGHYRINMTRPLYLRTIQQFPGEKPPFPLNHHINHTCLHANRHCVHAA